MDFHGSNMSLIDENAIEILSDSEEESETPQTPPRTPPSSSFLQDPSQRHKEPQSLKPKHLFTPNTPIIPIGNRIPRSVPTNLEKPRFSIYSPIKTNKETLEALSEEEEDYEYMPTFKKLKQQDEEDEEEMEEEESSETNVRRNITTEFLSPDGTESPKKSQISSKRSSLDRSMIFTESRRSTLSSQRKMPLPSKRLSLSSSPTKNTIPKPRFRSISQLAYSEDEEEEEDDEEKSVDIEEEILAIQLKKYYEAKQQKEQMAKKFEKIKAAQRELEEKMIKEKKEIDEMYKLRNLENVIN